MTVGDLDVRKIRERGIEIHRVHHGVRHRAALNYARQAGDHRNPDSPFRKHPLSAPQRRVAGPVVPPIVRNQHHQRFPADVVGGVTISVRVGQHRK